VLGLGLGLVFLLNASKPNSNFSTIILPQLSGILLLLLPIVVSLVEIFIFTKKGCILFESMKSIELTPHGQYSSSHRLSPSKVLGKLCFTLKKTPSREKSE
jgi:hypothetical protein